MSVTGNEEHKQRINLSSLALSVIEMDQSIFNEGGSLSGFLNRIITGFRHQAQASVGLVMEQRQQQLLQLGHDPATVRQLIDLYRQELCAKTESYPKGSSILFRLNNYNFDLLYTRQAEATAYSAPGKYLKALLEEYARLSPSEREAVYYRDSIDQTIQPALDGGWVLEVQVAGKPYRVRPYTLMADPFNSHLYLLGYASRTDQPNETVASFRITRLSNVKLRRQNGKLTAEEKNQIEKQLQQLGVQYLVGTADRIQVRLSKLGRQVFLQRSYMRPTPVKIEGDVYHFACSPLQIRNYFLSFGKEAKILQPQSVQREFAKFYKEAAKIYE